MTAINIWCFQDRAVVMTDGLIVTSGTGLRRGAINKVVPVIHMNAVLCVSGNALVAYNLGILFWYKFQKFDDAIHNEMLGVLLRDVIKEIEEAKIGEIGSCHIHFVGYSDMHKSFLSCMTTYKSSEYRDFSVDLLGGLQSPCPSLCDAETQAANKRLLSMKSNDDMEPDGIALMQGQARYDPATIGEFVQVTTLDHQGISMRIASQLL